MVSLFAEKMNGPTKYRHFQDADKETIGILYKIISSCTDEFSQIMIEYRHFSRKMFSLFADKLKGPTEYQHFYDTEKIKFLRKLSAFSSKWFLHLPTSFLRFWWNIGIFHEKWFLCLPKKWMARQKYQHFHDADKMIFLTNISACLTFIKFICRWIFLGHNKVSAFL